MGVDAAGLRFLLSARRAGVDFARTLTIGRQQLFLDGDDLRRAFGDYGAPLAPSDAAALLEGPRWAEPVLHRLGAGDVASLDASDYEGATIVHDMNRPVAAELSGRFTCVFDGGSLEHVFEFTTALRNCMEMVAVGGHLLAINPFDHYAGHGFWQLGPEVPFRALTPANGFELEQVLVADGADRWWEVTDPATVGRRAELPRRRPTLMYVRARRTEDRPPLREPPQESDYAAAWRGNAPPPPRRRGAALGRLLRRDVADPFLRRVRL